MSDAASLDLPSLDPARHALRDHVLRHSVRRGDFTLKSGAKSSWFLDTKQTACRPDGVLLMAEVALSIVPADAMKIITDECDALVREMQDDVATIAETTTTLKQG